jgi:multidrug efflux pump subunit AcrB
MTSLVTFLLFQRQGQIAPPPDARAHRIATPEDDASEAYDSELIRRAVATRLANVETVFDAISDGIDTITEIQRVTGIGKKLEHYTLPEGYELAQHYAVQPWSEQRFAMKWDGEWQITYETFRDMGIAFAVALLLIYLLIVAQFQSFLTPMVIMAPIPLTLIGILPGHWLTGSYFTATSMIGFIALAGIIVRNSILLVDFIQHQEAEGVPLLEAVIRAGAIRTRPILLTAAALMVGAFVIILDPIFQGLAVSLLFGVGASTILTLVVIPLLYYLWIGTRQPQPVCSLPQEGTDEVPRSTVGNQPG